MIKDRNGQVHENGAHANKTDGTTDSNYQQVKIDDTNEFKAIIE